ncbi:uncharacterized protein LOC105830767 [Monomorium pharaonis]|uniref:uncharacterized protein LOC105830767 n=1 Tax=Monomorium pharaonis TaxID=307658 RepID=UPI00063F07E2|nr:uncharacterized protein LOC105830767 [Monomorium pharaonis]
MALHSDSSLTDHETSTSSRLCIALPEIKLPSFSGDYQSWPSFYEDFVYLIRDNKDLSNAEKMYYLKTCLTGEAARSICYLTVTHDNFSVAWSLLLSKYDNRRLLIRAQLDRIINLKSQKNESAQELRNILTIFLSAIDYLRKLNCPVDEWDILFVHLLEKLLDSESRMAWEMKLGLTTIYPTFSELKEFLFERARVLENIELFASTSGSDKGHSTNSCKKSSYSKCPLCGASHYLAKCEQYQSETVQQRRDIIVKHRRCFNCLAPHAINKCTNIRRCQKCGRKHHTSIHGKAFSKHSVDTPVEEATN